jgi:hypothetical protein
MAVKTTYNGSEIMAQSVEVKDCPGFEGVELLFNLYAPESKANAFIQALGGKNTAEGVVLEVRNFPAEYGTDPWDPDKVPMIFRAWAGRKGWAAAMAGFLNDPNS